MKAEEIALLKQTIAKGLSDLELKLFLNVCDRTGLDPFSRQICPVLRWNKKANRNVMSIQVQIDGYRQIAQSTGENAGCDAALFDEGLSLYEHLKSGRKQPLTCSVTVYRLIKSVRCPFTAEVSWDEFYPGQELGFMWRDKPHQMMSKTAEAQALRKAFQSELKWLYTVEEMGVAVKDPTPRQVQSSDDWAEMAGAMRNAGSLEEVNAIAQSVSDRYPKAGNQYQLERERAIATELLEMGGSANVNPTDKPIVEKRVNPAPTTSSNPEGDRIRAVCKALETEPAKAYRDAIATLWIDKGSQDLTPSETSKIIDEICAQWGCSKGCFQHIDQARNSYITVSERLPEGVTAAQIVEAWKTEVTQRVEERQIATPVGGKP